jgi:hypothetical protein
MCNHCENHHACPDDIARRARILALREERMAQRARMMATANARVDVVEELRRQMVEACRTGKLVTPMVPQIGGRRPYGRREPLAS